MVVGWQFGSYLPHYGGPNGSRYGYGMGCVCACVLLVSKSTTQRTAAKLDKDTAVDRSKGPCRRAHGCALDCSFGP